MSASAPAPARRTARGLWWCVAFYLFTRLLIDFVAFAAPQDRSRPQFTWWPANALIRWDSGHYAAIMVHGYPPADPDGRIYDTAAFFPLFSAVTWPVWQAIRIVASTFAAAPIPTDSGADWTAHLALVLMSHLLGLLAIVVFWRWCEKIADAALATRAAILLAAFPAAMYFSTGYSESLFVLCAASTLWAQSSGRPWLAALACAAGTATRPTGIVLAAVLFLWNITDGDRSDFWRRFSRAAAIGVVSVAGLLAHECYLWSFYGRPDAYFVAQAAWQHPQPSGGAPWLKALTLQPVLEPAFRPLKYALRGEFDKLTDARNWNRLLNLALIIAATAGLVRPGRIPRVALLATLLVFLMAWLPDPFEGGRMLGITRYHLIGLPTFAWLAQQRWLARRAVFVPLIAALLALQCFYVAGYVNWILVS